MLIKKAPYFLANTLINRVFFFFNKGFSKINQPYGMLLLSLSSWYCATCFVGTENAADEESRQNIAVDKETGGSYVVSEVLGFIV